MSPFIFESFLKSSGILLFVLLIIPTLSYIEFRTISFIQRRSGSSGLKSWSPLGFWADFSKLLFKENNPLDTKSKLFYDLTPIAFFILSFLPLAAFPLCEAFYTVDGGKFSTEIIVSKWGLLYVWVTFSLSQWGPILVSYAGSSASSKRGAYRYASPLIAGEAVLALLIASIIFHFGSADINELAQAQLGIGRWSLPGWGMFIQPLAFGLFIILMSLRTSSFPFDIREYQEDTPFGGYNGVKLLLIKLSMQVRKLVSSLLIIFLFLGGYSLFPGLDLIVGQIPGSIYLFQFISLIFKLILILVFSSWVQHSYVRVRQNKSLEVYWKYLLPLSFLNFLSIVALNYWEIL